MTPPIRIAPSILSADFGRLADEVRAVEAAGADWIHVDVMDGRFVPNITIGPLVVEAVRKVTKLPIDAHLMIVEPERYVEAFAKAGADVIRVHAEVSPHLHRTLQAIRAAGARPARGAQPVHRPRGRRVRPRRLRHGPADDRQPGLRRPEVHRRLHREGAPPARHGRRPRAAARASRWTAASSRAIAAVGGRRRQRLRGRDRGLRGSPTTAEAIRGIRDGVARRRRAARASRRGGTPGCERPCARWAKVVAVVRPGSTLNQVEAPDGCGNGITSTAWPCQLAGEATGRSPRRAAAPQHLADGEPADAAPPAAAGGCRARAR